MRKNINRYTVTAVMFVVSIFIVSLLSITASVSDEETDFPEGTNSTIKKIENMFGDNIAGHNYFLNIWSITQKAIGASLFDDSEYGVIIRDNHGLLHFPCERTDVSECAENAVQFAKLAESRGIPFVYIQAPNKKLEGYTVLPPGGNNYSNENADDLLGILRDNGVDTFDLREKLEDFGIAKEDLFYISDHHWTTPTAFAAFREIVSFLNDSYGLNLDSDGFYCDISNYTVTTYENCFLGSLGRRVGRAVSGVDDYTLIEPNFDTDFETYDLPESIDSPLHSGSFRDALLHTERVENPDVSTNRYTVYFEWDYGDFVIKNNLADNNVKLLLVKDSFALPVAAFLSSCVSELHLMDLRGEYVESPSQYVNDTDFDAVLIMYTADTIEGEMFALAGEG